MIPFVPALALVLAIAGGGSGAARAGAGAGTSALPRRDVAPILESVFKRPFAFCHQPGYPFAAHDLRWCPVMTGKPEDSRCPELVRACSDKAALGTIDEGRQSQPAMPALEPVVRILLWALLGLGGAWMLVRLFGSALVRRRSDPSPTPERDRAVEETPLTETRLVETEVDRLLQRARTAAAIGNFGDAMADAYAALLRRLEGAGVVRVEAARTNGDHVRDVGRGHPALRPRLQAVITTVERAQFGDAAADETTFRAVHDGVVALIAERLGQYLPFAIGLALAATWAGCALNREQPDESPSGRAGVLTFLQRYGFQARERLVPLAKLDDSTEQLLVLPGVKVEPEDWSTIGSWVGRGGTLLVAGGGRDLPDWILPVISPDPLAASAPLTPVADEKERFGPLAAALPPGPELRLAHDDGRQTDGEGHLAWPLLTRGRALYAAQQGYQAGRVVVLADDHLFVNASLLVEGNAALMTDLLRPGGKRLELTSELTGLVSSNPFTSVRRGRLAPALLQLAALALLFFACKGAAFGRPIDPIASRRRAFSEHVRALGLQYARARASRHALDLYGAYALERMRDRLHMAGQRGLHSVAEAAAARSGRPVGSLMRLLLQAQPAPPGSAPGGSPEDDLATLREIATLLTEMGGPGERI